MDAVLGAARAAGWDEVALHREYFAGVVTKSSDDGASRCRSRPLRRSDPSRGRPVGRRSAGGCGGHRAPFVRTGCLWHLLDARDRGCSRPPRLYLTEDERARGDQFTPCCSRAKSPRLVLDL